MGIDNPPEYFDIRNIAHKGKNKNASNSSNKNENQYLIIDEKISPRGLNNIGATCYMNSVLQCLYHIYDLSKEILKLINNQNMTKEIFQKMPMTSAFLEVVYYLSFSEKRAISPHNFKEIISKNDSFKNYEANDSKNLTLYVLDTMNKEFSENKIQFKNVN